MEYKHDILVNNALIGYGVENLANALAGIAAVNIAQQSHRTILKNHKITQSMSRKGDCWAQHLKASSVL